MQTYGRDTEDDCMEVVADLTEKRVQRPNVLLWVPDEAVGVVDGEVDTVVGSVRSAIILSEFFTAHFLCLGI